MKNKILLLIIFLSFVLRFYKLGEVPASINWDEASNGYNAYSILETGRDEYGNFLPLYNRSFDDYKPPMYMYLNVLTVKIFGLNDFALRLPSAVLGTLIVPLMYFLVRRLLRRETIALFSAGLVATSPWTLHFSRVGFESNVGLFFGLLAITLLIHALPIQNQKASLKNVSF